MVGRTGFEPATSSSQSWRSTKLSYRPLFFTCLLIPKQALYQAKLHPRLLRSGNSNAEAQKREYFLFCDLGILCGYFLRRNSCRAPKDFLLAFSGGDRIFGFLVNRAVAQLGSALEWGSRGRGFESRRPERGAAKIAALPLSKDRLYGRGSIHGLLSMKRRAGVNNQSECTQLM